jgi:hypothetical protein
MLTAAYLPGLVGISPLDPLKVITFITSLIHHQSVNCNAPVLNEPRSAGKDQMSNLTS